MLRNKIRKKRLLPAVLLLITGVVAVIYWRGCHLKPEVSPTEQFIVQHMTNPNGTLATFLQDGVSEVPEIPAGRESLSESLGLWMQYASLKGDKALFDQSYEVLEQWFVMPEGYIAWKLSADGQSTVNTNALVDDFRIIEALLQAADRWDEETYRTAAIRLSDKVTSFLLKEGTFVDYFDFSRGESPDTISLSYLNMSAMSTMLRDNLLKTSIYDRHKQLLLNMPDDGRFYPKSYDLAQDAYIYDSTVNLIDQLLVALNCSDIGRASDPLLTFIQTEFAQRHQILGRYDRATGQPAESYESPAVYGLSILLALKMGDAEFASQLHNRMLQFRGQDPAYPGGYVFDKNTHLFDNLFPLIAEEALKQK